MTGSSRLRSSRNPLAAFLLLALFCWGQAGCSGDGGGPGQVVSLQPAGEAPAGAASVESRGRAGGELRYALAGEPNTFNYLAASDARSKLVALLTTGTLLEFDPVSQEVGPGVCIPSWGANGVSVRLELRQGLRFSDGVPADSEDLIFTLGRVFDPASSNVLKDSLSIDGEPLRFEALPSGDVEIAWDRPYSGIETALAAIPLLPQHLLDTGGAPRAVEEEWTLGTPPTAMAGLGPFKISGHVPGIRTELSRNPYYWKVDLDGRRLPYLDRVSLLYLEDRNAQILRFSLGQLDLVDQLRPEDFRLLEERGAGLTREFGPSNNVGFLWLNLNQPGSREDAVRYRWFSNRAFRRAISAAISRSAIVENVYLGLATEAAGLISPANSKWFAAAGPSPAKGIGEARELLTQAGFVLRPTDEGPRLLDPDGVPVRFELVTGTDDVQSRTASLLRQDLAEIGIEVAVRQEEFRAVISRVMGSRDYQAAMMNLDLPLEPLAMRDLLLSDGGMHFWRLDGSPPAPWELEIDRLMNEISLSPEREHQVRLFAQVQEILARECPVIPLVHRDILVARSPALAELEVASVFPYAWARAWEISKVDP